MYDLRSQVVHEFPPGILQPNMELLKKAYKIHECINKINEEIDMKHKTLYNTMANSPCGKCKKKNCELTVRQVKAKKCLGKNCWHLVKYENHEWWHQRELAKERKKERKQKREETLLRVGYKEANVHEKVN